jgi:anaerobic ribonucleoside-triphosphate reductase
MTKIEKIEEQIQEIEKKINDPLLCSNTSSTYSRISGYYRPLNNWNEGKKDEYLSRCEYVIN